MINLIENITPFLTKTTAIMTAVIILIIIGAVLVSTEKRINRQTVEKFISIIKRSVIGLILLEVLLSIIECVQFGLNLYYK